LTEVAVQDAADPPKVLDVFGLIESVLLPQCLDGGLIDVLALALQVLDIGCQKIPWRELDDDKRDHRDDEDGGYEQENPPDNVGDHTTPDSGVFKLSPL
jgi:hypothetical protein